MFYHAIQGLSLFVNTLHVGDTLYLLLSLSWYFIWLYLLHVTVLSYSENPLSLWSFTNFCSFSLSVLHPGWYLSHESRDLNVPFNTEHFTARYFLCTDKLRVSCVNCSLHYWKGTLLWWWLKDELVYASKRKYLRGGLILSLFSRIVVVVFHQNPWYPVTGYWSC